MNEYSLAKVQQSNKKLLIMKRLMLWVMAAILICGATVFTACGNDDKPVVSDDKLAEKLIGKWMISDIDGRSALTDEKEVITFVSPTKAYVSRSRDRSKELDGDSIRPSKPNKPDSKRGTRG